MNINQSPVIQFSSIQSNDMHRIIVILEKGGVIAYPTETVYGLGVDMFRPAAVRNLYALKGRDSNMPFLMLIPDLESLSPLIKELYSGAQILIDSFWPGPLTLLFQASDLVPKTITAGTGKVGVRISSEPFCQKLMELWKKPLISTSANLSQKPSALSVADCQKYFSNKLDLIIDAGVRNNNIPSTVLDVSQSPFQLIRGGAIGKDKIEELVGKL